MSEPLGKKGALNFKVKKPNGKKGNLNGYPNLIICFQSFILLDPYWPKKFFESASVSFKISTIFKQWK